MAQQYQSEQMVPALEAILIEALEPRQNRKRGDDLAAVEYLQQEDLEIKKQKLKGDLEALLKKAKSATCIDEDCITSHQQVPS